MTDSKSVGSRFESWQTRKDMKKLSFFKSKLVKPKILLGIPLAFYSLETFFGALAGYFLTKFLAGKEAGKPGKIKSIVFEIKNWKIHLHHWLIIFGFLNLALYYQFLPFPQFSFGFLGGAVFQGITYPDWYKIITRKKNNE